MEATEKPPAPLITRHDVRFLFDVSERLCALGYEATGRNLHEIAGRVSLASKALMDPETHERRPAVAEAVCDG